MRRIENWELRIEKGKRQGPKGRFFYFSILNSQFPIRFISGIFTLRPPFVTITCFSTRNST